MIDIKPEHEPFSNCIEDIFATVLKWKNRDCMLIFSNSWSFHYQKRASELPLIGQRVDIYKNGFSQLEESLMEHYAIKPIWSKLDDPKDIIGYSEEEIRKGEPICISIDAYCCPWNPGYQKYHASHYCLVIGTENNSLICVDSYLSKNIEVLKLEDYFNGFDHYFTIDFGKADCEVDWRKIITRAVNNVLKKENSLNDFDNMRELANEIRNYIDFKNEFAGYEDVGFAPIVPKINNISYGRKNFAKVLEYFFRKYNIIEFKACTQKLQDAGTRWSQINKLAIKYHIIGFNKASLIDLYDKINELAAYEENLAHHIMEIADEYKNKSSI